MSNIIWMASYPKSGNTWLRAFIYYLLHESETSVSLDAITRLFESESNPKYYQRFLAKPLAEASFEQLIALRPKVQHDILSAQPKGSIFLKTHNPLRVYNQTPLHNLTATAAAIYVVRNPLDLVISVAEHFNLSLDQSIEFINNPNTATVTDEQSVAGFLGSWSHHVESWTHSENPQFITLRYEDMLDKPLVTFTKVAKLLGLAVTRPALQRAIELASFKNLQRDEIQRGFAEKPIHAQKFFRVGRKNQWIDQLSNEQIEQIVAVNKTQMLRYSYVPPKFR